MVEPLLSGPGAWRPAREGMLAGARLLTLTLARGFAGVGITVGVAGPPVPLLHGEIARSWFERSSSSMAKELDGPAEHEPRRR